MKIIITILFLFASTLLKAQTIGAVTEQAVSGAGNMAYFIADGYFAADAAHRMFYDIRPGVGATNFANLKNESPFKELDNGTKTGKFLDKYGDTVYCFYKASYTGSNPCEDFVEHLDYIFTNWSGYIDSSAMRTARDFVIVGYSQGGQDISKILTTFCNVSVGYNTDKYRHFFHIIGGAETGDWHNLSQLQTLNTPLACWMWHDNISPTSTFPSSSQAVYDNIAIGNPNSPLSVKIKLYNTTHSTGDDSFWRQPTALDDATTSFEVWSRDTTDHPPPLQKITGIHARDIISITGHYITETNAKNFDEQGADPDNGVLTPTPTTTGMASQPIYFSHFLNEENRYVVDLRGRHVLNKVYFYVNNSFFSDSVIIYKGDFKNGWERIGSIYITSGTTGWNAITLDGTDTSSFLAIGHKGTWEPTYGVNGMADVREIIIYGDLIGDRNPAPASYPYTGEYREKPLMRELSGVNHQTGKVPSYYTRYKQYNRQGMQMEWLESAGGLLDYPNNTYDFNKFGLYPSVAYKHERYVADSIHNVQGHTYWTFIIFSNARYFDQGGPTEGHFVNNFGDNPYDISKYTRIGQYHWLQAAAYGTNEIDTNLLNFTGMPRYSGLRTKRRIENGNELNKFWGGQDSMNRAQSDKLYISPYSYTLQSQMDYDGYEGRYGPRIGIKVADDSSYLLNAALVGMDSIYYESTTKISRYMRDDSADIFNYGINFHYYPSNPTRGIHPALDSSAGKLSKFVDFCYRIDPNRKIIMSEGGFDAVNMDGNYSIPHSDSYTDRETQAIGRLFLKVEISRSRVDEYEVYNMNWSAEEDNGAPYQSSQERKDYPTDTAVVCHYTDLQFDSVMANYRHSSDISWGWQTNYNIKYVSSTNADSSIHFVGYPNTTGLTNTTTIFVGANKTVKKLTFNRTGYAPTLSTPTYNSSTGYVSDTLEGFPFLYIVVSQTENSSNGGIKRTNKILRRN